MRDAVRNKERWKRHRAPTQDPSTWGLARASLASSAAEHSLTSVLTLLDLRTRTFMGSPQWFGKDVRLSWTAGLVGGPVLHNGTSSLIGISIAQGEIAAVAAFGVTVPSVSTASKIAVSVTLDISGDRVAANEWTLSVFPTTVPKECPVPVLAAPELLHAAQRVCSNALAVSQQSLASQSGPFVLLRHNGMSKEDVAAISRAGGFGVAMNPRSGSWPVCGQSAVGSVELATLAFSQPWWISGGTTGTLVYNSSLTKSLGFAQAHNILDYGWMSVVEGGQAFVLDGLAAGSASSIHIRAIPADGVYATQLDFQTTVSNTALLWEGDLSAELGGTRAKGGRFLVSGLNLFDSAGTTPWLGIDSPVADFAFSKLVSYAVSETAAGRAALSPPHRVVVAAPIAKQGCNSTGSFCVASSAGTCQQANAGAAALPEVCNGNFEIMAAVCLPGPVELDALYPKLLAKTNGSRVIGVVYDVGLPSGPNKSFCSANVVAGHFPRRLVAKGPLTVLEATSEATWLRLPMPPTTLKAGSYWIGVLFEADTVCYSDAKAPNPAVGPGSRDAFAYQPFASGPSEGPGMTWTRGASGAFAIYATTH